MLRLLVVTGTRADLGLWRPVLGDATARGPNVDARLVVIGMHLDERFGATVEEAREMGVPIAAELAPTPAGDAPVDAATWLGNALVAIAPVIEREDPTWVCLLGDRGEQLAAAIAALHLGIAVAHLHGGERSLGAVDDAVRDMISRVAHLHLVATPDAADRLRRMGEEPWRIRIVGAPGLDDAKEVAPASPELRRRYDLPAEGDYLILIHHPETAGPREAFSGLEEVISALGSLGLPVLAIGPNADAGGRAMLERLASEADARFVFHTTVPRPDYLVLLAGAAALVGNSSSGIIEAPTLRVPAVNVGTRQLGRTRGDNVIDVPAVRAEIVAGIRQALDPAFRTGLSGMSPYGDGESARRIVDAIVEQPIDQRLLVKHVAP
jgi:GDP/UDP-N,N'-diacetylbacillosamine 2-epimerase (hydrolysing)